MKLEMRVYIYTDNPESRGYLKYRDDSFDNCIQKFFMTNFGFNKKICLMSVDFYYGSNYANFDTLLKSSDLFVTEWKYHNFIDSWDEVNNINQDPLIHKSKIKITVDDFLTEIKLKLLGH